VRAFLLYMAGMQHGRILIFENDPVISQYHAGVLEAAGGYKVCEVYNPDSVLEAAREFRPHLMLLDARMPGVVDGEFTAILERDPFLSETAVVIMSSEVVHARDRAVWGANFLLQSFDHAALLQTAEKHCPRFLPGVRFKSFLNR
jgi:CheY-like chemotaxis protein